MSKRGMWIWIALVLTPTSALADSESNGPRREAVFEAKFGQIVSDPYRWMENPDDAELRKWIAAENQRLVDQTRGPLFKDVLSDFQQTFNPATNFAANANRVEQIFDDRRLIRREHMRFRYRPSISIPDVVAPESGLEFSQTVSPNGRFSVVTDSDAFRDLGRLTVIDSELSTSTTDVRLPDSLTVRYSTVFWETDDTFLYTTGITGRSAGPQFGLYRHRLGTSQAEDTLLYRVSGAGDSLQLVRVGRDWYIDRFVNGVSTFGRLDLATGVVDPLFAGQQELYSVLAYAGGLFYFADFRDDPRGEIVSYAKDGTRQVVVSQAELGERALDVRFSPPIKVGDTWVVTVLEDSVSRILTVDPTSGGVHEIALPVEGSALVRSIFSSLLVFVSDHTTGFGLSELDVATGALTEIVPPPPAPLGLDLVSERVFYAAHNGQPTPIWVIRARDTKLSRRTPMVLYGYGGFRINNLAVFNNTYGPWLKRGGAVAIVTLPGGFEYGEEWHQAGQLLNKTNVFADFEAAAERLIELRYTRRRRLVALGGSNGGLLVGAVVNRRPELFGAAIAEVGVMDMLRFEQFTAGSFWTDEYGTIFERKSFNNLLAYSPYHNVLWGSASRKYPAILVATSDLDDRVIPGHSFKYAARLMHRSRSNRPVNLLTREWGSHGGSSLVDDQIRTEALKWTFVMQALGVD